MSDIPPIVDELFRAAMALNRSGMRRVRFAVTSKEYAEIEQFALAHSGFAAGRIRDIPLIVEDEPQNPPLIVHFAQAEACGDA